MADKHFYFPFYPKDFVSGTVAMRAEEVGAYIRLLCYQFENDVIPIEDKESLEIITGTKRLDAVLKKFPGGTNDRLKEVKDEVKRISDVRTLAIQKRYKTPTKPLQNPYKKPQLNINSNTNSNSEINSNTNTNLNIDTKKSDSGLQPVVFSFEGIWSLYPNKDGRKAAERSFRASVKTLQDYEDIKKALQNYLSSEKVQKGFIKNGSTWFNNWRDFVDYKPITAGTRMVAAAANLQKALERSQGQ